MRWTTGVYLRVCIGSAVCSLHGSALCIWEVAKLSRYGWTNDVFMCLFISSR